MQLQELSLIRHDVLYQRLARLSWHPELLWNCRWRDSVHLLTDHPHVYLRKTRKVMDAPDDSYGRGRNNSCRPLNLARPQGKDFLSSQFENIHVQNGLE